MNLHNLSPTTLGLDLDTILSSFQRSNRLRHERGVEDDLLLVKYVSGSETICGGIDFCVQCVAAYPVPSQQLIGCPIELQFDTTCDGPRFVCGIITRVIEGLSQDGLFTFQPMLMDDPVTTKPRKLKHQKARERGWGEVFFDRYRQLLEMCELRLNTAFHLGVLDDWWT